MIGYTNRTNIENFLGQTFPITDAEVNGYIEQAESYINNYLGYNAETTVSGIMTQTIEREKVYGKIDNFNNLVIDLMKPPVHFDQYSNPMVTKIEFNYGAIRVPLQITDGTTNSLNSVLTVSENRRKVYYPSLYFFPAISTVTPTAKVNLFNLHDVKFWVDIWYTGGYDTVPADITAATNLIAGELLLHRKNPQMASSIKQGQYSIDFMVGKMKGKYSPTQELANTYLQPYIRYTW